MENKENFEIIKKFGPSILKVKIPENIISQLNTYVDQIINDKELSKNLNHGEELVGDVTQEIKLQRKMIKETGWADFLALNVSKWIFSEIGKSSSQFIINLNLPSSL